MNKSIDGFILILKTMYLMCIVIQFNLTQFYLPNHNNSCLNVLSFIKQKAKQKGELHLLLYHCISFFLSESLYHCFCYCSD